MQKKFALSVSMLALAMLAACSSTPTTPAAAAPAMAKGEQLIAPTGEPLFINKKDAAGKSNCVRDCLKVFRPLFSSPDDKAVGQFATLERPDGMSQWAYKGAPLYVCPTKAGDTKKAEACAKAATGDWIAAKP